MNWNEILSLDINDPNISMNNLHLHINYLLDEFAPYKKVSKKQYKLKSKPWINGEILSKMKKRDKLLHKYCKTIDKESISSKAIYDDYKSTRNELTKLKRDIKIECYHKYFELNKHKTASLWKGITRKDITLMNDNGINIPDPKKIAELY